MRGIKHMIAGVILCCTLFHDALGDHGGIHYGVRSIFLHAPKYTGARHDLTLTLESKKHHKTVSVPALEFSYHVLEDFSIPEAPHFTLRMRNNSREIFDLNFALKDGYVEIEKKKCTGITSFPQAYPYRKFSSYMPPNTGKVACYTPLGILEIELICRPIALCTRTHSDNADE